MKESVISLKKIAYFREKNISAYVKMIDKSRRDRGIAPMYIHIDIYFFISVAILAQAFAYFREDP